MGGFFPPPSGSDSPASRMESRRVAGKIVSKLKKWMGEQAGDGHCFRGLWKVSFLCFLKFSQCKILYIRALNINLSTDVTMDNLYKDIRRITKMEGSWF